jgi:ABC-type glycerol-3-phosphate transport system substrate-binding protein
MKRLTIFLSLVLLLVATGCSSQSDAKASEVDTKELIADTKEIVAMAEDVYGSGREYTAEEEVEIEFYEEQYGEIEDTDIKLTVNSALMVAYDAKRLDGVEDTFARDFEYVNILIEEMENGAPLE